MTKDERPSDSSDFALRQLRALLDSRAAGDDKQLPPERALALQLSVGRRTLRRALDVLEAEGRLWRHQGKGTFLGPRPARADTSVEELSSRTNPLEVMEARLGIEPMLARLAALRASNGDIERLEHLAHKTGTSAATDTDNRELWDGAFHRAIAEAAGNSLLFAFMDMINQIRQDPTWRRLREQARSPAGERTYVHYHHRIVAAIAARDGRGAEQAMREHLEAVRESLVKIMTKPAQDNYDIQTANGQPSNDQGRPAA
ncbi:FadR/GntR family transcriptional regulator [Microvirga terricola]|uniref:FadR family transcriptional regulator n=1 Tax=Microvirga terricola TaxID=2719797 RepID=A0ABX0VBV1_9HYPH|nr:FCD domain-containing protein [Microvirga terricola]NIX76185.1 FadR family transcriptional regulator [Microvirga terricola]